MGPPNWMRIWSLKLAILLAFVLAIVSLWRDESYLFAFILVVFAFDVVAAKIEPWDLELEEEE